MKLGEKKYGIKQTDKETLEKWFFVMSLARLLDEKAPNYLRQAIGWSYHAPAAGHDAIQLAIGQVFNREKDHLFPYYRDLVTAVSAGLSAEEIIYNGISRDADVAGGGRHMSNHFAKPVWHIHNVSSCTGNHTLHAVGLARAIKYYGQKGVAISSQGESSVSEGYVYEAITGADREKLPVVFVFQDNGYGISVSKKDQTAARKVANNFGGFKNITIMHCNGKDVFDSMNTMSEAVELAEEQHKPVIVHANCVRMGSHSNSDRHELYRDSNELNYVQAYDPLMKFKRMLLRYERFTEEELDAVVAKAQGLVKEAHRKAINAPNPSPESIHDFVYPAEYSCERYPTGLHQEQSGEKVKLVQALNDTLRKEFEYNEHTFMWGQDMANKDKGGIFNVSKGLQQQFGEKRIFNAPIAEDFIMGTANGMSRYSKDIRIIVEGAEFADYFWPAMEQFVETTHEYWRTKGQFSPNITVRLASGGYIGGGLYHSQTIEAVLTTFPGVRIVYPAFADDAAGLLRTSIRSQGLTLFLEPKALYNAPQAATVVPDDFEVPFGKARVRHEGKDLTIITYGNTVHLSLDIAKEMQEQGIGIEVLDLRSLIPLDKAAILASVEKTNRVLIVHEDKVFGGFGGELSATITELAFEHLDAPIMRVGSTFTPVGFNPVLEAAILPDKKRIATAVQALLAY